MSIEVNNRGAARKRSTWGGHKVLFGLAAPSHYSTLRCRPGMSAIDP